MDAEARWRFRARGRSKRNPLSPIRIRRASRRGRGGVFDLAMGVGRFHALQPTFGGVFSVIPIQLTKAVVENGSDVGPFSPLPIHLCALCDLCGIPPHSHPESLAQRRGGVFEPAWGEGQCSHPCFWGKCDRITVSNLPSLFQDGAHPREQTSPSSPSRLASFPFHFPFPSHQAVRGRGDSGVELLGSSWRQE